MFIALNGILVLLFTTHKLQHISMFTSLSKHVSTKAFHYSWSFTNKTLKSSHWVGSTTVCFVFVHWQKPRALRGFVLFGNGIRGGLLLDRTRIHVLLYDTSTVRWGNIYVKIESGWACAIRCYIVLQLNVYYRFWNTPYRAAVYFWSQCFCLATSYMSPWIDLLAIEVSCEAEYNLA